MSVLRTGLVCLALAAAIEARGPVAIAAQARVASTSAATREQPDHGRGQSAAQAVTAALVDRLGPGVDVRIESIDVSGDAAVFAEARLHPASRLGQPLRVTLVTTTGAALPATARAVVVGERVVTARAVARGQALAAEDLRSERAEIAGVPVRRLPGLAQLVGSRALRVLPEGAVVLENAVSLRRAVEPGDAVSVVAAAGAVEVTATFIAADGGDPGAVIRVVNPETRRYVRARVKEDAVVEVIDAR